MVAESDILMTKVRSISWSGHRRRWPERHHPRCCWNWAAPLLPAWRR